MFNLASKKQKEITVVHTKEELKRAVKRKDTYISVQGDLARKIKWMTKLSSAKVVSLIGVLSTISIVGSPVAGTTAAAIANITGKEIAAIILSGGISISLIMGILKGYIVEMEVKGECVILRMKK